MPFKEINLFNLESWQGAGLTKKNEQSEGVAAGHSVIKISPNYNFYSSKRNDLKPIVGVILNNVSVNVESEWQQMGVSKVPLIQSIGSFKDSVSDYTSLAGAGEMGSVWMSKQLWRKNGYLRIAPEFRIVDWDGTGKPLSNSLIIAKMLMPGRPDDSLSNSVENLSDKLQNVIQKALDKISESSEENKEWYENKKQSKIGSLGLLLNETAGNLAGNLETAKNNILDDVHDLITLRKAPPPVTIQIGQYFYHPDMIIKNASFKFSKEVSKLGPLYVDVTLDIETRKIMRGIDDVGFVNVGKLESRVNINRVNIDLNNRPQVTGLGGR